jgi:hypothetical protein
MSGPSKCSTHLAGSPIRRAEDSNILKAQVAGLTFTAAPPESYLQAMWTREISA